MIVPSKYSLNLVRHIAKNMEGNTFHHHFHVLYDILASMNKSPVTYVEIGTASGGSACLMLASPKKTRVVGIDIGNYAPRELIERNVEKFGLKSNTFNYILGDSKKQETIDELTRLVPEIDILFIDGDHAYQGVIDDFLNYKSLVSSGGFIVFDDYHDWEFSAQVKHGVDFIARELLYDQFDVIGSLRNVLGAEPINKDFTENNTFIIKKK